MPSRTRTANQAIVALPSPDNRTFDFTNTPNSPYAIRITVPKGSTWTGGDIRWHEAYRVRLRCEGGRVHVCIGTGLCSNADLFFGAGSEVTCGKFSIVYWQRSEQLQNGGELRKLEEVAPETHLRSERRSLLGLDEKRDAWSSPPTPASDDEDLVVDISPSLDPQNQIYHARHELLYRHIASLTLDAPIYPTLPTTPLPIRLLFHLPIFLFPAPIRIYLMNCFLSIQLLVLYSAFDYHPYLGSLPIAFLYGLIFCWKYWVPFAPQLPEWVCRAQWESGIVVSHVKVWVWAWVGRMLLGMRVVYAEYTPKRLEHALGPILREDIAGRENSTGAGAMV